MTKSLFFLLSLACLCRASPGWAESNRSHGAALVHACAACHGPDGHSQGAIPSFTTLPKERLVAALRAFRDDTRPGTVMNRIAKGLEDADIEAIAAYVTKPRD
jgi:cytochrome subunit of sulfide dehydrogenase